MTDYKNWTGDKYTLKLLLFETGPATSEIQIENTLVLALAVAGTEEFCIEFCSYREQIL